MEAKLYNMQGKETGTVTLPEVLFGLPWNADLVHQVVVSMQANARQSGAHTKDRSEVRGGGKKPWKQKGTGRARHGSTRSPIWTHGGVAHGPRNEKIYARKINRKVREKALLTTLSQKFRDGEVIFVDRIAMKEPKSRDAQAVLAGLAKQGFADLISKKKNAALVILPRADRIADKSFANFGHVITEEVRNLNPVTLLGSKYLIIAEPEAAFETLMQKKVLQGKADKTAPKAPKKVAAKEKAAKAK